MITDADRLGEGGAKTKYHHNVAALKLLQTLTMENRPASREEQAVLVKYVGWGGIPQAFDYRNTEWQAEYQELARLLQKEEYEAARRSTQDAHYTSQPVVEAMYAALSRLGFEGGRILEPAIGSGHFVGLMPFALRGKAHVTGIELDPVTAQIAKHLYPSATLINRGFQEITIPEHYFDLVIGNPPFGSQSVYDPNHRDISKFSIHNYFISKSLDKVREGGIVALVMSNYFLDAQDRSARAHIASHAHLLGAIRLPNTAFKKNALTEVTTDIIFLQKAKEGETPDRSWVDIGTIPNPESGSDIPLNSYFIHRPEMMLGLMKRVGRMYESGLPALVAHPDQDLSAALVTAISTLPSNIYASHNATQDIETATHRTAIEVPEEVKFGAYFVTKESQIAQRLDDILDEPQARLVTTKKEKALERINGMIRIRTALRKLMRAEQTENTNDAALSMLRAQLNTIYDGFIRRNGYINSLVNKQAMGEDPDYPLLQSLEHHYDKGISKETAQKHGVASREPSAQKVAIFSKRVMSPRREIRTVDSAKDALVVSMNETGGADLELMSRLSGKQEDKLIRELQGLIFQNPQTQRWETANRYLTGNVKAKLRIATEAADNDNRYKDNVEALKRVQPRDIEPIDISIQLGSTWTPTSIVDEFVEHLLGDVPRSISYQASVGKWIVKIGQGNPTTMHVTWGTNEVPANELIEAILTNRSIQVKDVVGYDASRNLIRKTNAEKTAAATQKADEIRQAFLDWVWEDQSRRESLAKHYNERFNTNVAPRYDGSHLTLPGASTAIELRPHQKDAVWRGIQEGTVLYDHVVGAGKTFVCIATAQESKRMGLIKKPMFVVPNHLLLQWKDDIYKLYPNANVLIAEKSDFTKENRQKLFGRIATGNWDAVVIGHSSFKKIGMPSQTLETLLIEQIEDITEAILNLKAEQGGRITIKEMEKARDRMSAQLKRALAIKDKDTVVTFDELGVDALYVDEADEFKNLFIATSLSRISGLGHLKGSDKAFDLFVKVRYLQKQNGGRSVYFATGTPVANTIAEIYTMQRYMQYDEMKARGIYHFDAWASTFGQVTTGWELDATGVNYRLNSRFSKFQNVPELTALYRSFADVITTEDLQRQATERGMRFPSPKIKGGKPTNIVVDRSEKQAKFMGMQEPILDDDGMPRRREDGSIITTWMPGSIIYRMEHLPPDSHIDNPLKITNDARKAGLDFRLIDPNAPDFKGSKVNVAIDEMVRIWQKWRDKHGTQLVFCDLSTPKSSKSIHVPNAQENIDIDHDESGEVELSMDEILASSHSNQFSVYDDIKAKLIACGIPSEEIRFIHEAKTDMQRAQLFEQVRRGEVRFLLGSTTKMGAGMNVQTRLVAVHHLDAPWRPRDLEQREGRILRQGNIFYEEDPDGFEVEINRYATKQTYDSRMWQTIEYKAGAIEQFRRGEGISRVIEDVASEAANAAEMKAAATGNPLILLQVQLSAELKKLEALYANHKRNRHTLESTAAWLKQADDRANRAITIYQQEIQRRDMNTKQEWSIQVGQHSFNAKSKALLIELISKNMRRAIEGRAQMLTDKPHMIHVGQYRGFTIDVFSTQNQIQFKVKGEDTYEPTNLQYRRDDQFSMAGFLHRIDHFLNAFEECIESARYRRIDELAELDKVERELGKPFAQLRELESVRKNASDAIVELKKMQGDPAYVSTWKPAKIELTQSHQIAAEHLQKIPALQKQRLDSASGKLVAPFGRGGRSA